MPEYVLSFHSCRNAGVRYGVTPFPNADSEIHLRPMTLGASPSSFVSTCWCHRRFESVDLACCGDYSVIVPRRTNCSLNASKQSAPVPATSPGRIAGQLGRQRTEPRQPRSSAQNSRNTGSTRLRYCGSMTSPARRPPSSSPTTCWTSSRSGPWSSRQTAGSECQSAFPWQLLDRGLGHRYNKPPPPGVGMASPVGQCLAG
jgi:hypothetical protein